MKGIVHRDLSPSNILICPSNFATPSFEAITTVGRLNDLDHSKVDKEYKRAKPEMVSLDAAEMEHQTSGVHYNFERYFLDRNYRNKSIKLDSKTCESLISVTTNVLSAEIDSALADPEDYQPIQYLHAVVKSLRVAGLWLEIQDRVLKRKPPVVLLEDLKLIDLTVNTRHFPLTCLL
jgi:serine/threonine protein kinase